MSHYLTNAKSVNNVKLHTYAAINGNYPTDVFYDNSNEIVQLGIHKIVL